MDWQNRFTAMSLTSNEAIPDLVITHLSSWNTILVSGEDKKSYLQGQLTCDLVKLAADESTLGAHCDAKGKVWSIYRLFKHHEQYALIHHASTTDVSLKEIRKYSVFSKVEISLSDDVLLGVMGSNADSIIDSLTETRSEVRKLSKGSAIKVEQNRWLILTDSEAAQQFVNSTSGAVLCDEAIWDKLDIEHGIPRVTNEIQNLHIPQTFNLHAINGISFSKGCYTGQETVARAKYRGANKRAMFKVSGHLSPSQTSAWELERSVGENWRSAGSLIMNYRHADGHTIGLIILPNDIEPETILRLADSPDSIWKIDSLPYSLPE